jgi:hypothetical protein
MDMREQGSVDQTEEMQHEDVDDVPPLTKDEILALRNLLRDSAIVLTACPIAVRALSKR